MMTITQKVPLPKTCWTPQEHWVWSQVCTGKIADFRSRRHCSWKNFWLPFEGTCNWSDTRILRPAFLETILLHKTYRDTVPHQGVRIYGAWVREQLNLSYSTLTYPLILAFCRFEADADFSAMQTAYQFSLDGTSFTCKAKRVNFDHSKMGGVLSMAKSNIADTLRMHALQVQDDLIMSDATFAKVELTDAKIEGQLSMTKARITGTLNMSGLEVERGLWMEGVHVNDTMQMNSAWILGDVRMRKAIGTKVTLKNAKIEGQLDMQEAHVTTTLEMSRLKVGGSLGMRRARLAAVDLSGAEVGGHLILTEATIENHVLPHKYIKALAVPPKYGAAR